MARLNRETANGTLELRGRADRMAEKFIELSGVKTGADGIYLIESTSHHLTQHSRITSIAIEADQSAKV